MTRQKDRAVLGRQRPRGAMARAPWMNISVCVNARTCMFIKQSTAKPYFTTSHHHITITSNTKQRTNSGCLILPEAGMWRVQRT